MRLPLLLLLVLTACNQVTPRSSACPIPPKWDPADQITLKEEHQLIEGRTATVSTHKYSLYFCDIGEANCTVAELPLTRRVFQEWLNLRDESRICAGK